MTHVSIRGLSKTYPDTTAPSVDSLSLDIPSGELTALLGPSGCGKTTTMKMISGLLKPTRGDITFDGRSIVKDKPENRGVVMVFQNYLLFPYMSVAENVGFGLRMRRRHKAEINQRVQDMLNLVKLPGLGARNPAELSGGQQQRVALARALIVDPKVLLLDEPLSNLDAHLRLEMRDLIRDLQKQMGITTIFVTHDQEEAVVLADRVALMLDGKLRQYDPPESFYQRPADIDVAKFFGGRNFLTGESRDGLFISPIGQLLLPDGVLAGKGILTIRPEAIRIGASHENNIEVTVRERIFLGTQTRLQLIVGPVTFDALLSPNIAEGIHPGDTIQINLPRNSLWVMPVLPDDTQHA